MPRLSKKQAHNLGAAQHFTACVILKFLCQEDSISFSPEEVRSVGWWVQRQDECWIMVSRETEVDRLEISLFLAKSAAFSSQTEDNSHKYDQGWGTG